MLASPCLPEQQLRAALREIIVRGAQKSEGWGISQSLLDTVFVRASLNLSCHGVPLVRTPPSPSRMLLLLLLLFLLLLLLSLLLLLLLFLLRLL